MANRQNHSSNQLMKKISLFILVLCSSWGFLAHKTLQQVSIYQLPDGLASYFYANQEYIVQQSIRPDVRRKDDKLEDAKHYLDMDAELFGATVNKRAPSYESLVATAAQTVFTTTVNTFANGSGKSYIQVFVNGLLQREGATKAYTVTGANEITFNTGLLVNDEVDLYSFA